MSTDKISPEIIAAIGAISGAILITIIVIIVVCKRKKDKEKKEKEKELEESKKNELNEKNKEEIEDKDKEDDSNNDKKEDKEEMKEDKNDNKNNKDTKIKIKKELNKEIKFNDDVNLEMSNIALKDKDATLDIARINLIFSPNKSILKDEEIKIDKEKKSVLLAVGNEILHNIIEQGEKEYVEQMHYQHSQGSNKSANKTMKDINLVELMNYSFEDRPRIYDDESEYIEEDDDKRQNEYKENQSELRKITIKLKEKIKNSQKGVKAEEEEEETKDKKYSQIITYDDRQKPETTPKIIPENIAKADE